MSTVLKASRPLYWVNTAFPFAAGWLALGAPLTWSFWVALAFFVFPYNLAMYGINDIYDWESDMRNPRKATAEGARLERRDFARLWRQIALWGIPFLAVLLSQGTPAARLILAVAALAVVAYSAPPLRTKEVPFLDSATSSLHFWLPLAYGLALAGGTLPATLLVAYFFWGMASHAFGAVQDIPFDREAGISSVGTALGARATVWFAVVLYAAAATLVAASRLGLAGSLGTAGIAAYALNAARFLGTTDKESPAANRGWKAFLSLNMGMGAYLTALFFVSRSGWLSAGWAAVIGAIAGGFAYGRFVHRPTGTRQE